MIIRETESMHTRMRETLYGGIRLDLKDCLVAVFGPRILLLSAFEAAN